jgi:hypothetical protein
VKALKIRPDGSIKLPREVLRRFPSPSELAIWTENDTIILKRLNPLKPSQFAEREPEEEMPLEEIAAEVHRMHREKQKRRD